MAGVPQMRKTGIVKWFSEAKGFGFIIPDDGSEELFCHYSAIRQSSPGRRNLHDDEPVEFETIQGPKGPQAVAVVRIADTVI
jgi:CspA family cold shock protein